MKMKKIFLENILILSIGILFIILFNFIIDPYQYFRKPKFYKMTNLNSRYLNAGLVKHQDYDSIILGTSMTENISTSEVNNLFGYKTLKLSNSAARLPDIKRNLNYVKKHKKIENIIYGLDIYTFNEEKNFMRAEVPDYLYKNFNKDIIVSYLLNLRGVLDSLKIIKNNINQNTKTLDNLYNWDENKKNLNNIVETKNDYMKRRKNLKITSLTSQEIFEKMLENYKYNLKPLLEENKGKNIIIYFTPYSILSYKLWQEEGVLEAYRNFEKFLCEEFLKYSNVKAYYFKNNKKITHNLNNFYDVQHHTAKINSDILKDIKNNENKLSINNYELFIDNWYSQVIDFDVESLK